MQCQTTAVSLGALIELLLAQAADMQIAPEERARFVSEALGRLLAASGNGGFARELAQLTA